MSVRLQGKIAIVTGAVRGIGRAYALRFAMLGADVVVVDINLNSAREFDDALTASSVTGEIQALGRKSIGIQANVANRDAAKPMVEQVLAEFGRIDILVNNAGGATAAIETSRPSMMTDSDMERLLSINLMSAIYCSQAVVPTMRAQRSGVIVNIASVLGLLPGDEGTYAHYGMAKNAVIHFTRSLAVELGPNNIRVNCIAPAVIETARIIAMASKRKAGDMTNAAKIPLRRFGTPEDCANVLEFLASDLSSYVTGQCISVNGGLPAIPS